ncbi:MAG: class I SAM-dependent methyltransferase [Methanofastidiosum sp.]
MIDINANETTIMPLIINEPLKECTLELYNHFGRYFYASKLLDIQKTDSIIDASCGCGYGSYILSKKVCKVFGLDINIDNLSLAKKHYNNDNIEYYSYDEFFKTYFVVDKILLIETFEHIPQKDIDQFIKNLLNHLKQGGSMFITVPLGNNEASSYNQWHCNEPSIDFLYGMFSFYFKNINMDIDSYLNSFGHECQYCYLMLNNKK